MMRACLVGTGDAIACPSAKMLPGQAFGKQNSARLWGRRRGHEKGRPKAPFGQCEACGLTPAG
jgi:hypothetical protein